MSSLHSNQTSIPAALVLGPRPSPVGAGIVVRWIEMDELESRTAELDFLQALSVCRNPAFEWNYLVPALKHLTTQNMESGRSNSKAVRVLIAEQNSSADERRILGLVPIQEKQILRLPFRAAEIWKHDFCFNTTPLLFKDLAAQVWQAMCERLVEEGFALLSMDTVSGHPEFDRVLNAVERSLKFARFQRQLIHRPALRTTNNAAEYLSQFVSKKIRENGRRLFRRLEEQGQVSWEHSDDSSDFARLTEDFLQLEASGWKGQQGTALGCLESTSSFYRELVASSASADKARFLALKLDGNPIAMVSDFRSGNEVYSFKTAYDQRHAYYSPGQQTIVKNIEFLHRDGIAVADSCAIPSSTTFHRIWGQGLPFQNVLFSLRPGVARSVVRTLPALKSVLRRRS